MGRAQSDTYSSLFTKSDNVNLDETFDRKSALVHVLRHRVDTGNSSNYRAVALGSIYGKILYNIILSVQQEELKTSDLQLGYKSESLTIMCVLPL